MSAVPADGNGATPIEGRIEAIRDGVVEGWAWHPSEAGEPVILRVVLDGVELGTAEAALPRPTLAAAGIGDGRHGFRFSLPDEVAEPGAHVLEVQTEQDGPSLIGASGFAVSVGDEPGLWRGVEFRLSSDRGDGEDEGAPEGAEETAEDEGAPEGTEGEDEGAAEGAEETAGAPLPAVDGRLDRVNDGVIEGWAWRPGAPSERLELTVWLDGDRAGRVTADRPRAGLAAAGIGDGEHAFSFALPAELAHPGTTILRVESDGVAVPAARGFRVETVRSDSPWYGARITVAREPPPGTAEGETVGPGKPVEPTSRPPGPPVLGRDGWLFEAAVVGLYSDESAAGRIAANVLALAESLDQLSERVADVGVKLLPVLIPAKEHVYPDQLPSLLHSRLLPRPGDLAVRELLAHPRVDALDLMPALQAGADELPVCSPTGSELSEWGWYCAYRAIVKRVAVMLPAVSAPVVFEASSALAAPPRRWREAVTVMTDSGLVTSQPEDLPEPPAEPVIEPPDGGAEPTPREHLARLDASFAVGWEQPEARERPRCLLVGDPAHEDLSAWVARHFRFTVLIGSESPVIDLVAVERPDVVVYLVSERALLTLG